MSIVEIIKLCILTVNRKRVLCQVISSYTEEIHLLSKLAAHNYSSRSLNHNSTLRITEFNSLLCKLSLNFILNNLNLINFLFADYHRIHDRYVSIRTCSVKGAQLCLEYLRSCKTYSYCTKTKSRIILFIQSEIITLLISTDIKSSYNYRFSSHAFSYSTIYVELFFFCWKCIRFKIYEFTSKQSDSCCIIGNNICKILNVTNIRVKLNLLAI